MRRAAALMLCFIILAGFVPAATAAGEYNFKAKLTIDNKIVFSWGNIDNASIDVYATDNSDGSGEIPVVQNLNSKSTEYVYDFIADNAQYYNYYIFKIKKNGVTTDTVLKPTDFIFPRLSKEITNLDHPYVFVTQKEIDRTKELIKTNEYYKNNFTGFKKAADGCVEKYKDAEKYQDVNMVKVPEEAELCAAVWALTGEEQYFDVVKKLLFIVVDYLYENTSIDSEMKMDYGYAKYCIAAYDIIYNGLNEVERQVIENGAVRVWVKRISGYARGHLSNIGGDIDLNLQAGLLLRDQNYIDWAVERDGYGLKFMLLNGINDDGSHWNYPTMYCMGRVGYYYQYAQYFYNSGYDMFNYTVSGTRPTDWTSSSMNYRDIENGDIVEVKGRNVLKELLDFCFYYVYSDLSYPVLGDTKPDIYKLSRNEILAFMEIVINHSDDARAKWLLSQAYGENRTKLSFPDILTMIRAKPVIGEGKFEIGSGYYSKKGYNKLGNSVFEDYGQSIFRSSGDKNTAINSSLVWKNYREEGHSHSDMLSLTAYGVGQNILFDPGSYVYGTSGQAFYATKTVGHNTVIVDEKEHDYGSYDDAPEYIHKGFLSNAIISPEVSAIKAWTDRMYKGEELNATLQRTLWQTGDYIIDIFEGNSAGEHTYDYLLNINGELADSTATLKDTANTPLGSGGYAYVKKYKESENTDKQWSNTYSLSNGGSAKLTMLGADNTKVIAAKALNRDEEYLAEKLVVRRKANDTTAFIGIIEPAYDGMQYKKIEELNVKIKGNIIDWANAAKISDTEKGTEDTVLYGKSYGLKETGSLTSDAESAFLRCQTGNDILLGIIDGKYASGKKLGMKFSAASSAQLSKVSDKVYRLDLGAGTQGKTKVCLYGIPSTYNVYKADMEDEKNLQLINTNGGHLFTAEPGGIYFIAEDKLDVKQVEQKTIAFVQGNGKYLDYGRKLDIAVNDDTPQAAIPKGEIIEAEDVTTQIGGKIRFVSYDTDSHTTDNKNGTAFYGWDNVGHILKWKINVPGGKYKIAIRYATQETTGAQRTIAINDEEPYILNFESTGAWSQRNIGTLKADDGSDKIFDFNDGENVVTMENLQNALNLDCIVLIPIN